MRGQQSADNILYGPNKARHKKRATILQEIKDNMIDKDLSALEADILYQFGQLLTENAGRVTIEDVYQSFLPNQGVLFLTKRRVTALMQSLWDKSYIDILSDRENNDGIEYSLSEQGSLLVRKFTLQQVKGFLTRECLS